MVAEVLRDLGLGEGAEPRPEGLYVDGTLGGGGHAKAVLEAAGPRARLLGIDRDLEALEEARRVLVPFGDRVRLVHGCFGDLAELAAEHGFSGCDGVLLDLGVSSHQLDAPGRGFSFSQGGPLDMRMDTSVGESAAELLERIDEDGLATLLRDLGEVRRPRRIARAILNGGAPKTTAELADRVRKATPAARSRRHHPATLVFQALRIALNGELRQLDTFLAALPSPLRVGGRIALLSYHSLEDRRVKLALRGLSDVCVCPPALPACGCGRTPSLSLATRRSIAAGEPELAENPRARSARLRSAERVSEEAA